MTPWRCLVQSEDPHLRAARLTDCQLGVLICVLFAVRFLIPRKVLVEFFQTKQLTLALSIL